MTRHELAIVLQRDWRTALALLVIVYGATFFIVCVLYRAPRRSNSQDRSIVRGPVWGAASQK